jgi:WD40 repeat protein
MTLLSSSSLPGFSITDPNLGIRQVFGGKPFHADGDLLALAFAADGTLWSVEEPGVLRHWDLVTGRQLAWRLLDDLSTLWEFSSDARLLAGASDDLSLWDVASGEPRVVLPQSTWVTALSFSPDGSLLATGDDDGRVQIWDTTGHRVARTLTGHRSAVSALAFSADGQRLASAGEDKAICLWDVANEKLLGALLGHTDRIPALAWHPRGDRLFSAGWDTTARVWDTTTGEPVILLNSHTDQVTMLALSHDGQLLACADSANALHLWRVADHRTLAVFREHEAEVHCLAFSRDGRQLASGGGDRVIRSWTPPLPATPAISPGYAAPTPVWAGCGKPLDEQSPDLRAGVAATPDGKRLISTSGGTVLRIWDLAAGRLQAQLEEATVFQAVALSSDGRWLAGSGSDAAVRLWETATGRRCHLLESTVSPIAALAFSPHGALLASGSPSGSDVWLWDVQTGQPALIIPDAAYGSSIEALAFHPQDGLLAVAGVDWLATSGSDGVVSLWDVAARREVATFLGGAVAVAFHPSGSQLAVASLVQLVRVWDVTGTQLLAELGGHDEAVTCLAYSPDGRWLVSGSLDRTVRLWDARSGAPAGGMELDTQVKALCFSSDGSHLFTGNGNTSCYQLEVRRLLGR